MTTDHLVPTTDAFRVPLGHTSDVTGLEHLLAQGRLRADDVVAVTGKTEGGQGPDTSRLDADHAIRRFLLDNGTRSAEEIDQIPMAFTKGGIGILAPNIVVFTRSLGEPVADGSSRMAVGVARSAVVQPEWMMTNQLVQANAEAVRAAAADAGLQPAEVEYVVGKAYYPTPDAFAEARRAGASIPELDDKVLFRRASGSAGLGVAVAVDGMAVPNAEDIGENMSLYSSRVAVSANQWEPVGGDGPQTNLVALGNRTGVGGRLRIGHTAMADYLDVEALHRALRNAGLNVGPGPLSEQDRARVVAVFVKFSFPASGTLRGRRLVVEGAAYPSEVKAALGGMFASQLQDNLLWISAGASHQGPNGGATVAAIVDVS